MSLQLNYTISEEDDLKTLKDFIKKEGISKKLLVATKHQGGQILVNGEPQTVRYVLKLNDLVTVVFPDEKRSEGLTPFKYDLDIVYEDEFLLVINKVANMATIPSMKHPHQTVANALIAYYDKKEIRSTVHFVNRLDRDTSGLLVVAKYRHIHHVLTKDIKLIKRQYYALVKGSVALDHQTINQPIARMSPDTVKRCVHHAGDTSITHCEVLKRYDNQTLVKCELETGRTHQIRVHLSFLNHPLIGDTLYDESALELEQGHLLHSYEVSFMHPMTSQMMVFSTPLPDRFLTQLN